MGANEKFCLRWNDFETNISVAFRDIREEKDFFDLTLSCGSRQVQAHRLVLSACSPFFRTVLKQNPHQHPLLYLKGVSFTDLQSVLNFMYHGEVNIAQEDLNSFLAVAEELQVKGLTQSNIPTNPPTPKANILSEATRTRPAPLKKPEPQKQIHHGQQITQAAANNKQACQSLQQEAMIMVKTEPASQQEEGIRETTGTEIASTEEHYVESYDGDGYDVYEEQGYEGQDQAYAGHVEYGDSAGQKGVIDTSSYISLGYNEAGLKTFTCTMCGKGFKNNAHVRTHIENVHAGEKVQCGVCQKVLKNKQSLITHCSVMHGLTKYQIYSN